MFDETWRGNVKNDLRIFDEVYRNYVKTLFCREIFDSES